MITWIIMLLKAWSARARSSAPSSAPGQTDATSGPIVARGGVGTSAHSTLPTTENLWILPSKWFQGLKPVEVNLNVLQYIKHPSMFIGTWSTLLVLEDEFELAEKNQLTTLPRLAREWIVSHDLNPTMYSQSRRTRSIHLKGSDQYGSRTPDIFLSQQEKCQFARL